MRLQIETHELSELLQVHKDAVEGRVSAEANLAHEREVNRGLEREIRGLNSRIENVARNMGNPAMVPGTNVVMSQSTINEMLIKVCGELAEGRKIGAIKLVREYTQLGLKEAKDIVEGTTARASGW